ncbi:MAG: PepSY domain-containing protein [Fimbriimonadales bacterium]
MYKFFRKWHKWLGVVFAVFFLNVAVTGFILSNKDRWSWVKPPTAKGDAPVFDNSLTLRQIADAAISAGHPELSSLDEIDRIELHAEKSVAKVRAKNGLREVQVCAATGRVLNSGVRWDQLAENVHDFRYFSILLRDWLLPAVAVVLAYMALSGFGIALVPGIRRRRFQQGRPV